jgi:hypothetical protein
MVEYVAHALKQTSRESTILLYATTLDPHLQKMTDLADRSFCFYEMPRLKAEQRPTRRCQETRERWRITHGWPQDRAKTPSHQTPRPLLATGDTLKGSRTSLLVLA